MKPLSSINGILILYLLFLSVTILGCSSETPKCPTCADKDPLNPTVNFRIIDKLTNRDLFFGKDAKFSLSNLKIHHLVNGLPDSAIVKVDTAKKVFKLKILYKNDADTLSLQIGGGKPDLLYIENSVAAQCCIHIYASSASLNSNVIYTDTNKTYTAKDTGILKVITIAK